ncbi:unnamed protein product [Rhodiola kirilowii]
MNVFLNHASFSMASNRPSAQAQINLEVTVVAGFGLQNEQWFGKKGAYVLVQYGSTQYRTRTCKDGSINPVFSHDKFEFKPIEGPDHNLRVTVLNSNTNNPIGKGKVDLQYVFSSGYHECTCLLTNDKTSAGEIRLILRYQNTQLEQAKLDLENMKVKLAGKDEEMTALRDELNACSRSARLEQAATQRARTSESALKKTQSELMRMRSELYTFRQAAMQKPAATAKDMILESTSNKMQAMMAAKEAQVITLTSALDACREVAQQEKAVVNKMLADSELALKQIQTAQIEELAALKKELEAASLRVINYELAQKKLQADLANKDIELTAMGAKLEFSDRNTKMEEMATELALKEMRADNASKVAEMTALREELSAGGDQVFKQNRMLKKMQSELKVKDHELISLRAQFKIYSKTSQSQSQLEQELKKMQSELTAKDRELHTLNKLFDDCHRAAEQDHKSALNKQKQLNVKLGSVMCVIINIFYFYKSTLEDKGSSEELKAAINEMIEILTNTLDINDECIYQFVTSSDEDDIVRALRSILEWI